MKDNVIEDSAPATTVRLLIIENDPQDAKLALRELRGAGFEIQADIIQTPAELESCLERSSYDAILADYNLPGWTGMDALAAIRRNHLYPPFILVTGTLGEEGAVECIKQGASDYVLKGSLARLPLALARALREQELRRARIRAEHEVRERESRFRALIEKSSDGIALVDRDGMFLESSLAAAPILGCSPRDHAGTSLFGVLHPEDISKAKEIFTEVLGGSGRVVPFEVRCRHRDTSWRWIEGVAHNLLAEPSVQAVVIHYRDITQRKQAEALLHLRTEALEAAANAIVITDCHGTIVWLNRAVTDLTGYTGEELLGRNPRILKSEKQDPAFYQDLWQTILAGKVWHGEIVNRRKDASLYTEDQTITPVRDSAGSITHFIAIKQDVTDRKQQEKDIQRLNEGLEQRVIERTAELVAANRKLETEVSERKMAQQALAKFQRRAQLILKSAGDGILGLNVEGRCIFSNPAAARILGYTEEELIGQDIQVLTQHLLPDGTPCTPEKCGLTAALKSGVSGHVENHVVHRKDGTAISVDYVYAPIAEGGEVVGVVIVFRDVSERQAVQKMKDDFVSMVSHELRTPLTALRGALVLLSVEEITRQPERARQLLKIALNNTDRLVRLTTSVLDSARLESGQVPLTRQACAAPDLIHQAIDLMSAIAESAGVTLEADPQPLILFADPDAIQQTLSNLISNAIKFSPRGSTVRVDCRLADGKVAFRVIDQGSGIPKDKLQSIFGRFQPVDAADARRRGGSGLGLSICRTIVERHGGSIWAESEFGSGCTFTFTLPVDPGQH